MSIDTLPALPTLSLPAELTIYTASETRASWLAWLAAEPADAGGDGRCTVHAGAVDQVDAAGVQLLVALSHTLARQQRRLLLLDPSTPLCVACEALGASALLAGCATDPGAAEARSSAAKPVVHAAAAPANTSANTPAAARAAGQAHAEVA